MAPVSSERLARWDLGSDVGGLVLQALWDVREARVYELDALWDVRTKLVEVVRARWDLSLSIGAVEVRALWSLSSELHVAFRVFFDLTPPVGVAELLARWDVATTEAIATLDALWDLTFLAGLRARWDVATSDSTAELLAAWDVGGPVEVLVRALWGVAGVVAMRTGAVSWELNSLDPVHRELRAAWDLLDPHHRNVELHWEGDA